MGSWISAVLGAASSVTLGSMVVFLLRATLIAAIGRLALAVLPRASAASRHLIATVTLAALVALPVATAVLPSWRLPILPGREQFRAAAPAMSLGSANLFVRRTYDVFDGDTPIAAKAVRVTTERPALPTRSAPALPFAWPLGLALVLVAIAEVMLLRCALSLAAAAWFARSAEDVSDPTLRDAFDAACEQLDVSRSVHLRMTSRVSVPLIAGIFRPALLLPSQAQHWDRERLDIVFLHELAHVQRYDALSLLVARAARALYWFHPVVSDLAREARRECEQACDDRVLASGIRASIYAEHLLTIARGATGRHALGGAALAIANPSNLEQRLALILRAGVERAPASRRAVALAALLGGLFLMPLASVQVTAATARAPQSKSDTLAWQARPASPAAPRRPAVTPRSVIAPATPVAPASPAPARDSWGSGGSANDSYAGPQRSGSDWYSRARRNYERENYSAAGQQYVRAARAGYNIETAYYNAACSFALDHQAEQALACLGDAVHAGWDDADHMNSDDDLDFIRHDRRFRQLVEEARHANPDESDRRSAGAKFDALRAQHSTDPDEWGSAGVSLMHSGDSKRAIEAFQNQIKLQPASNALYNLACAHALNGDHPAAYDALEGAIAAGFGDASHMRKDDDLESLQGEQRFDELVRMTELLELNDDGLSDNEPRGWNRVLPRYERVVKQFPTVGRAWFNLGYAQLRSRQFEPSRISFERALDLGYRRGTTQYDLACVSAQLRDAAGAVRWLERAESEGMGLVLYLATDRDLDPIRSDSRFREFKRRVDDESFDRGRHMLKRKLDNLGRALDNL